MDGRNGLLDREDLNQVLKERGGPDRWRWGNAGSSEQAGWAGAEASQKWAVRAGAGCGLDETIGALSGGLNDVYSTLAIRWHWKFLHRGWWGSRQSFGSVKLGLTLNTYWLEKAGDCVGVHLSLGSLFCMGDCSLKILPEIDIQIAKQLHCKLSIFQQIVSQENLLISWHFLILHQLVSSFPTIIREAW